MGLREQVLAHIEPLRKAKQIGSSLQTKVVLSGSRSALAPLEAQADHLPMLFIVSEVELRPSTRDDDARSGQGPSTRDEEAARSGRGPIEIAIERALGVKCERCWRYVPAVSTDAATAGICERCQHALAQAAGGGEAPEARKPAGAAVQGRANG
jgi:isoleucyl-tRNA synthetase